MFRSMDVGPEGYVTMNEGSTDIAAPLADKIRWIDLCSQSDAELEMLRTGFQFHPLAIEDCSHFDQRPKVEEYDSYLFVVTQGFQCNEEPIRELIINELHAFIGPNFLVTVHSEVIEALELTWRRVVGEPKLARRGPDFIYYLIADRMVDDNFPIFDKLSGELEALEETVLNGPKQENLARIFELKHHLVVMRKVLSPQRDVLATLSKHGSPHINERTSIYFRDVFDHLLRINESIDAIRDLLSNALEAYLSSVSQRNNEVMKYLTIMSAVFLPLAFVVGFFGQNFDQLLGIRNWVQSETLMWSMICMCLSIPIFMLLWFKKRNWL